MYSFIVPSIIYSYIDQVFWILLWTDLRKIQGLVVPDLEDVNLIFSGGEEKIDFVHAEKWFLWKFQMNIRTE